MLAKLLSRAFRAEMAGDFVATFLHCAILDPWYDKKDAFPAVWDIKGQVEGG
jgi:hypothetical protein